MRLLLLSLMTLFVPLIAVGQQFRGRVYDRLTAASLPSVLVTNMRTGSMWRGDSSGNVAFSAEPGDEMSFQRKGYYEYTLKIAAYTDLVLIGMERAPIQLQEVEVLSPMARFKRDSAFNHQFFRKELSYAHSQVGMSGIGATGLISQLALIATGKQKAAKRFAKEFQYLEDLQLNSVRYTPALVASQTGLSDSAAELFIVRHPIENAFLRVASELELKQLIRDTYREELRSIDSLKAKRIIQFPGRSKDTVTSIEH